MFPEQGYSSPMATQKQTWITTRLAEMGLTQVQLAERLGITAPAMSGVISGSRKLQVTEAIDMAAALQMPIDTVCLLITGKVAPPAPESVANANLIDRAMLAKSLALSHHVIAEITADLPPDKFAEMILSAYDRYHAYCNRERDEP